MDGSKDDQAVGINKDGMTAREALEYLQELDLEEATLDEPPAIAALVQPL